MELSRQGEVLQVQLPPLFTCGTVGTCYTQLMDSLADTTIRQVVVAAEQVETWDDTGLAVLVELQRNCRRREIGYRLQGAQPRFQERLDSARGGDLREVLAATGSWSLPLVVADRTLDLLSNLQVILLYIGDVALGLFQALRHPRQVRWRDTLFYMDRCGTDGVPIVMLICYLMGLILGFQSALQLHQFGADQFVADLVGLSIVRELGPLMVAMICTGRAGSAFAAEIGTMKVSEEVDALVTMGLNPTRFLIVPKVLGLVAVMPFLTVFGDILGVLGGFTVGTLSLGIPTTAYLSRTMTALSPFDLAEGLVKSIVFALLISGVGCLRGMQTRNSAQAVGRSTTSAVVAGITLVIVADALLTIVFSRFRG